MVARLSGDFHPPPHRQPFTVSRQHHGVDLARLSRCTLAPDRAHGLAARQLPHADGLVVGGRNELPPVRRKRNSLMSAICPPVSSCRTGTSVGSACACSTGSAPSVAASRFSLPPRNRRSLISVFGPLPSTAATKPAVLSTSTPSSESRMSSGNSPAFSAGPPGTGLTSFAPRGLSQPSASASCFVTSWIWAPSQPLACSCAPAAPLMQKQNRRMNKRPHRNPPKQLSAAR